MADRHRINRKHCKRTNKGKENRSGRKIQKKQKKRHSFVVFPYSHVDWQRLARMAWVYWPGRGEPLLYRLDFLDNHELRTFWSMDNEQKADYLSSKFNRHHRRPRCQKGPTTQENLSQVDIYSHVCYNKLISAIACWSGISIERVVTADIAKFLRKVYPPLKKLMSRSDDEKLKGVGAVVDQKNLKELSPIFIVSVARWSRIKPQSVHVLNVSLFLEFMYAPIRRLALDHDSGRLKTQVEFFKILNDIWLPKDEQIRLTWP